MNDRHLGRVTLISFVGHVLMALKLGQAKGDGLGVAPRPIKVSHRVSNERFGIVAHAMRGKEASNFRERLLGGHSVLAQAVQPTCFFQDPGECRALTKAFRQVNRYRLAILPVSANLDRR